MVPRYQGPLNNNYYLGWITLQAGGQLKAFIGRMSNGTLTVLSSPAPATFADPTPGNPIPLDFVVEGSSLKLYVNSVLKAFTSNSGLATGGVGMFSKIGRASCRE